MNRNSLAALFGLVAVLAVALSAQTTFSNGTAARGTIHSIRIKVIGCVASGADAHYYRLTNAVLSGDDVPSAAGTTGTVGSGKDLSFENSPSIDLISGDLKAHVGHKVEVIGITSDTQLDNRDAVRSAIGSSAHEQATLTVSSVLMIAARCP